MIGAAEIFEKKKALDSALAVKQSAFKEGSAEHRLYEHMGRSLWKYWKTSVPTERELYALAAWNLNYQPSSSFVASQVLPDSVKEEIFDRCEREGAGFAFGMLVSSKMMAIIGNPVSDHHVLDYRNLAERSRGLYGMQHIHLEDNPLMRERPDSPAKYVFPEVDYKEVDKAPLPPGVENHLARMFEDILYPKK
jgi:hypothetical protein